MKGLAFLLSIGLVTGIIWQIGPDEISDHLHRVGWRICFVFFMGFPRFFLNTVGWRLFLSPGMPPLPRLYRVKIAGELLTRVTPIHFLGGDSARVLLLGKTDSQARLAASVVMDRTAITMGGAFFILTGVILGSFLLPIGLPVKLALAGMMTGIGALLLFLITKQKKGMIASGIQLLKKVGLTRLLSVKRIEIWEKKGIEVDATLKSYYQEGHGKIFYATLFNYLGRWVAAGEIYLLFLLLDIPLGPLHAVMFLSISLLLTASFFVVPGTLGIAEGTYGLFFHLLGLNPAIGVSLELSRKINGLLWYAFGGLLALTSIFPTSYMSDSHIQRRTGPQLK